MTNAMEDKKKRLAFAVLEFLQTSIQDQTISSDNAESVEGWIM
jgi:hypothetical protein